MLLTPKPYDPSWAQTFQTLQTKLMGATDIAKTHIQHIGSTSVNGLWAKPIIDIQMGVDSLDSFELHTVTAAGFSPALEITQDDPFTLDADSPTAWQKKYARLEHEGQRIAHLHIRQIGNPNHRFALLFRDFLRNSPETCALYSEFKVAAAKIASKSSDQGGSGDYLNLKDAFVKLVAHRAEDWATSTRWTAP